MSKYCLETVEYRILNIWTNQTQFARIIMFERYNRYVVFLYLLLNLEHLVFCWTEYSEGAASFVPRVSKHLIQPHEQQQQREDDDDPDWDDDDLRLCLSVNGKIIALVCCLLNATKISLTLILQFGKLCKKEFHTIVVLFMSCQILEATKQKRPRFITLSQCSGIILQFHLLYNKSTNRKPRYWVTRTAVKYFTYSVQRDDFYSFS